MEEKEETKVKYVCEGSCKAQVTQEEHDAGSHVCQTKGCTHYGQHFKKVEVSDEVEVGEGPKKST